MTGAQPIARSLLSDATGQACFSNRKQVFNELSYSESWCRSGVFPGDLEMQLLLVIGLTSASCNLLLAFEMLWCYLAQ